VKIIIDFNPSTQLVEGISLTDELYTKVYKLTDMVEPEDNSLSSSITSISDTPPVKKERKKKEVKEDNCIKITVGDNKLILTTKLVNLLEVKEGDRLAVMYRESNGFIEPFLGKAELFTGATGNKLTKSSTVSFRGDQRESLLKFGTEFEVENMNDGSVKLISDKQVKTPDPKPVTDLPKELADILKNEDENLDLTTTTFKL